MPININDVLSNQQKQDGLSDDFINQSLRDSGINIKEATNKFDVLKTGILFNLCIVNFGILNVLNEYKNIFILILLAISIIFVLVSLFSILQSGFIQTIACIRQNKGVQKYINFLINKDDRTCNSCKEKTLLKQVIAREDDLSYMEDDAISKHAKRATLFLQLSMLFTALTIISIIVYRATTL